MAEALKVGIRDLLPEFLAHAFGVLAAFCPAGTVSAGPFQTFANHLDNFRIGI